MLLLDTCEIKDVTKCEGEATANNRKAKLIFFYEWDIKGEWKGSLQLLILTDFKSIYYRFDFDN